MTTYSKNSPYGMKYATYLYLIYRIEDGKLQALGLYENEEAVQKELAAITTSTGWMTQEILCPGWAIINGVAEGNVSHNHAVERR